MRATGWASGLVMLSLGGVLITGCAAGAFNKDDTPGQRFERAMKGLAENCAKAKLKPNDTACDILKLKPADPLATEEGRFAHSIKIPNPVPEDSGYKPGMTPEQYFDHLCKTEAGEFIYKTVESVDGLYMMRPRERVFDDHMQHLYAMEDPYGYTDWEARDPQTIFVDPPWRTFSFLETPVLKLNSSETVGAPYKRYSGYVQDKSPMREELQRSLKSQFGYTWRGISRLRDRDLGIAGGELIVVNLKTKEVLGVRRGYIRTGAVRNNLTGVWWLTGQVCPNFEVRKNRPKDGDFSYWFISKVLKPTNANSNSQEGSDANK
jgi:hypothetical protein